MAVHAQARLGSRGQPEQTRAAILEAALEEFAQHGPSGARTEAIARAAGVNKALLYYYFKDKETLFRAVLDDVFSRLLARVCEALDRPLPPREKILAYAGAHFDFVASSAHYPKLVQWEMMRTAGGRSPHIKHIVEKFFRPVFSRVVQALGKGIESGDFRPVDPPQFVVSMVAIIVFYFSNTNVMRLFHEGDPLSPERIAQRRAAVLDFISAALFAPSVKKGRGK